MSASAALPPASAANAPAWAQNFTHRWHRVECVVAVAAYGLIALLLVLDVMGRELLGPIFKAFDIKGATGLYGAQKASVYALVLASFCGIGIATATGSHLVPRVGFAWIPKAWGPAMDRLADLLTALFARDLAAVARAARHRAETRHSWDTTFEALSGLYGRLTAAQADAPLALSA